MGFSPAGGKISGADDVAVSGLATGNYFGYDATVAKWRNIPLVGNVATANGGGKETISTASLTAATRVPDLASANVFNYTLTRNVTFTSFSGATASTACSFTMYLRQDGTGGRTVVLPSTVRWPGGIVPSLSSGANAVDIFVFESLDGGTTWFGSLVGADFRLPG